MKGRFLQGDSISSSAGQKIEAGLPNIEGSFVLRHNNYSTNYETGAFAPMERKPPNIAYASGAGSVTATDHVIFNASLANPIYGNSDTVQPPAYIVKYFIRALP